MTRILPESVPTKSRPRESKAIEVGPVKALRANSGTFELSAKMLKSNPGAMTTARNCARVVDGKLIAESMSAKIAMRLKTYEDFDLGKTSLPLVHCIAECGLISINEDTCPNPH